MDITYSYTKLRSAFGAQPMFCESGPELCDSIPENVLEHKNFILRNPVHTASQNTPTFWHNDINTIRTEYMNSGVNHLEGGWPKDVNVYDPEHTMRYRRKIEREAGYIHCVLTASKGMESNIFQNNAIDMYETYFVTKPPMPEVERLSCRTLNVYRDPVTVEAPPSVRKRPVSSICWRPDGRTFFAATYLDMDFNRIVKSSTDAYIWDLNNASAPKSTITPPFAMLDLQYNPRNVEILACGMLNGQVAAWDIRTSCTNPSAICPPHVAHRDLVRSVKFISSKSGMEFFSGSADGCCKWWDVRNMSDPIDAMIMDSVTYSFDVHSMARAAAISCIEFESTMPTKFTVGTENGWVLTGNRKGKTALDQVGGKIEAHLGPVWKVERNPAFLKNILTVGDWTARIWSDECKDSAVLWSPPHRYKISDGAWSPTRLSMFTLSLTNGMITFWDLLRRQHEPVLTMQVCDEQLSRIAAHEAGSIIAYGSANGAIYVVEVSRSLSESDKHDKGLMTAIFERETKRERILEARLREIKLKAQGPTEPVTTASQEFLMETAGDKDLIEVTNNYNQIVKKELSLM